MSRQALGAFELRDGAWVCFRTIELNNADGFVVQIERGTRVRPRTTLAGHADFGAYLDVMSIEAPSPAPHG